MRRARVMSAGVPGRPGAPPESTGSSPPGSLLRGLPAAAALFALWIALSGKLDLFHLGMGFIAAFAVAFGVRHLHKLPPQSMPPEQLARIPLGIPRFAMYAGWLAVQIFRSALGVALLVLDPRLPIRPRVVRIADALPHGVARLTLAHSITLTPGTVTIDCDPDGMVVHAISESAAHDLGTTGGSMAERVRRLFPAR